MLHTEEKWWKKSNTTLKERLINVAENKERRTVTTHEYSQALLSSFKRLRKVARQNKNKIKIKRQRINNILQE